VLAHRRLAVIDPTPAGHQPMVAADGRTALVYNGELYNDAEIRAELERGGVVFRTACDTETVLAALERWGPGAMCRLRGMYALGYVDLRTRRLILARDPLGIKPLYYAIAQRGGGGSEVVFASEIPALLAHPGLSAQPDLVTVSSYLTTIRTTLGRRSHLLPALRRAGQHSHRDRGPPARCGTVHVLLGGRGRGRGLRVRAPGRAPTGHPACRGAGTPRDVCAPLA
jgi:asparagine synthase (glutamine-hydrolysing)